MNIEQFVNAVVRDLDEGRPQDASNRLHEEAYKVNNNKYDAVVDLQTAVFLIRKREQKEVGADLRITGQGQQGMVSIVYPKQECGTPFPGQGQQRPCRTVTATLQVMQMTLPAVFPIQQPRRQDQFIEPRVR